MTKRFLCRQCKLVFDLEKLTATEKGEECPGCRSADVVEENRSRKCPACNSDHLHLLTNKGAEPLYCG